VDAHGRTDWTPVIEHGGHGGRLSVGSEDGADRQVQGDPNPVLVSTMEAERLVTRWCGLEQTDLTPAAARQLAAYLRRAAGRAERR
jgi:hypothetical protein